MVLEVRGELTDRLGALGVGRVVAPPDGCDIVTSSMIEQVEGRGDSRASPEAHHGAIDMARGRFSQSMETIRRGKCFHGLAARPRSRRRWLTSSASTMRNSRPNFSAISPRHLRQDWPGRR